MQNENPNQFNFFNEIKKENTYRLLFPKPEVGMAIIWLYERITDQSFSHGEFKEKDIHRAFEEVNYRPGEDKKHLWEHYSGFISELQEFFLDYNQEKQVYTFREYAFKFCKQAKDTIIGSFNPTQIEKICRNIHEALDQANTLDELIDWFALHFLPFQTQLREQIDFLDKQIETAVAQLRLNTARKNTKITDILKEVELDLDKIQQQNKELRSAFRETDEIKILLERKVMPYTDRKLGDYTSDAISFFRSIKDKLRSVDSKLDRIQPKIQQLFSTLNKPLFNTKVEKFLRFIINKSEIVRDSGVKKLVLPARVHLPKMYIATPSLTITKRKADLFPAKPKKKVVFIENTESRERLLLESTRKLIQQEEIQEWVNKIKNELTNVDELYISPYFFDMVTVKQGNADLAVRVIHRFIREMRGSKTWKIDIEKELVTSNKKKEIKLWKLKVQKRKQIS